MRPLPLFQLTGWTHFVDEEVEPPALAAGSSPTEDRKTDEQAIAYHRHLRMVPTDAVTHMQEMVVEAVHSNSGRREGLMDHVIDGPAGTGKTCLLRAIGRTAQREVEAAMGGRRQNTIPVVHITTPADPEPRVNWLWEIGSYLGLEPRAEEPRGSPGHAQAPGRDPAGQLRPGNRTDPPAAHRRHQPRLPTAPGERAPLLRLPARQAGHLHRLLRHRRQPPPAPGPHPGRRADPGQRGEPGTARTGGTAGPNPSRPHPPSCCR